jgi:hypothetical protein
MARTREHIIESESRRIVSSTLPAERFVERDQTERDYGIDMSFEHFYEGEPTGRLLLLQIKGTDAEPHAEGKRTIPFDAKVKHLLRCERFATPILLVWVPVKDHAQRAWFLWVQSYIRIGLEYDNPKWRSQKTVRLHIPTSNLLGDPRMENKLVHIAGDPSRSAAFGQLSRLAHEARWAMDDPETLASIFKAALGLDAIFGDPTWQWGQDQRAMIEKGLLACELALAGRDPSDEQLREIGWFLEVMPPLDEWEHRWHLLAIGAQHCARLMSAAVALYYDNRLRHSVWKAVGDHDF